MGAGVFGGEMMVAEAVIEPAGFASESMPS